MASSKPCRAAHDFRSDTFTTPTPAMLDAMVNATFGDGVYEKDHTTIEFQNEITRLTGVEDALHGQSNWGSSSPRPASTLDSVRLSAYVYAEEGSGLAILSQAMVTPVHPANGIYLTLADVKLWVVLGDDVHAAPTKVHQSRNYRGEIHCDGARLWNASVASGHSLANYCQYFDSVSMCVSKGLGAPIGGVLASTKASVKHARWLRKQQEQCQKFSLKLMDERIALLNQISDEAIENLKAAHCQCSGNYEELTTWIRSQGSSLWL
ncbi:threonine aldolase [Paracoccidioides lutzii Pb01]|uniref:Threonine aldolase n=1 Tax=Paracoccidioides lutzii (strain ATCC MYA-826 / Pb01) TaxID=502779 RepID=C1GPR4_PARBA|nr:threonine aldolase [Paracoccidioides lutzii Pb01]EEH36186.2 threonine aldolase [Paracoccidioides lutzii Pb01]